ncbi:MAG: Ig-like domain-containing protein, partial [Ghiorsea sp.]
MHKFLDIRLMLLIVLFSLNACDGSNGNAIDGTLTDGASAQATVSVNQAVPFTKTLATPINTPISITLKSSEALMFHIKGQPGNGTLTGELDGEEPTMTYSPKIDYVGTDKILVDVTDAEGKVVEG